jgi:fluoride exporter
VAYLVVAVGGGLGAVLRWWLGDTVPDGSGFPWTTFAVNVTGSLALACLPLSAAVRHHRLVAAGLGPGLLGGYTTMSSFSEQTRSLVADGHTSTALLYLFGTLVACVVAVELATRLYPPASGDEFAAEGGDE